MGELTVVKPGWLRRTIDDAWRSLLKDHTPMEVVRLGHPVTIPIPVEDAREMYARMDAHFYAWTGQHLKEFEL